MASSFTGSVPETYLRSDAVFPTDENGYRKRLFELLGVKYMLDKEDDPKTGKDWHYERFPNDKLKGIWQEGKFQVYEREQVLPRIFQTTSYLVTNDKEIINNIYDKNFDLSIVQLENAPTLEITQSTPGFIVPEVVKYAPGEIVIKTNSPVNSLLFISDAFDPDWKVKVDDSNSTILRAHYALSAVEVPQGEHTVYFKYDPASFRYGLFISLLALISISILTVYKIKKKSF